MKPMKKMIDWKKGSNYKEFSQRKGFRSISERAIVAMKS